MEGGRRNKEMLASGRVALSCSLSTQEMEAGGLHVRRMPGIQKEFQVRQSYTS